jgi:hypothetical protein
LALGVVLMRMFFPIAAVGGRCGGRGRERTGRRRQPSGSRGGWRRSGGRDETGHRGGDERTCFCCCVAPRLTTSTSHGAQERQGARPVKASTVQSEQSQVRGRDRDCTGGTCIVYCIPYKLSRQAKNYLRSGVSPTPTRKTTSAWRLFKIAVVFFKNM